MRIKTIGFKGSKRRLINNIISLIEELDGVNTVFDGFSGSGIVSANLRNHGYEVTANDKNYFSYIFAKVFLEGYDKKEFNQYFDILQEQSYPGWITENYSGTQMRVPRGSNTLQERPLGYTLENAQNIDGIREMIDALDISQRTRNAYICSLILAADKVFNNTGDQKSAFKEWLPAALKPLRLIPPANISGITGQAFNEDILSSSIPDIYDLIYLDPPYSNGVLYESSYQVSNSIALWDKPELDKSYAIPRRIDAAFGKSKTAGKFYSKKTIEQDFKDVLEHYKCRYALVSYSDAPRNLIQIQDLVDICYEHGTVTTYALDHKICTQFSMQNKQHTKLKEYLILVQR